MDTLDEITSKIKLKILQMLDYQLLLTTKMVEEELSKANLEEFLLHMQDLIPNIHCPDQLLKAKAEYLK